MSPRLEELCGHYANRLSYENLEDLIRRFNEAANETAGGVIKSESSAQEEMEERLSQ